ncbi:MAG: response regulator transcription factor [Ornithinimicrobium sp.]
MSLPVVPARIAPRPIRVAIANDYPLVIAGTARALECYPAQVRVVEYASRTQVTSQVDVVLFDTFAEAPGAADVRTQVFSGSVLSQVLVLTWQTHPVMVRAALAAGAAGVVSKTVTAAALVEAVMRVHRGERVVPTPEPSDTELSGFGRWPGDRSGISARESEVLAMICQGFSNQVIAESMYLTTNTVKTYIRSLYRKIGVVTRPQAVIWGISNGFRPQTTRTYPRTLKTQEPT